MQFSVAKLYYSTTKIIFHIVKSISIFFFFFYNFYTNVTTFFLFSVQLLGIPAQVLQHGLTHRKIEAKTEEVT